MLKRKKRSWIKELRINRFSFGESDIAFQCEKHFPGFTKGKVYKPFAYSVNEYRYTDFALLDDLNRIMYMQKDLLKNKIFRIIYKGSTVKNEYLSEQDEMIKEMYREQNYRKWFPKIEGEA